MKRNIQLVLLSFIVFLSINVALTNAALDATVDHIRITINYTPDTTSPIATLGTNQPDLTVSNNRTRTFDVKCTDNTAVATLILYADWTGSWIANFTNSTPVNNTWSNITVSGIPDGVWTWGLNCVDTAGNSVFSGNRTLTMDANPPDLNFVLPTLANNSYTTNQNWGFFNISSDKNLSSCLLWNGTQNLTMNTVGSRTFLCYQETANISTSCGGLSTGGYLMGELVDATWVYPGRISDGTWTSMGYANPTTGGYYSGSYYENETLLRNNTQHAIKVNVTFKYHDGITGVLTTTNFTVPDVQVVSIATSSNPTLQLKLVSEGLGDFSAQGTGLFYKNTTGDWATLIDNYEAGTAGSQFLYETGIWITFETDMRSCYYNITGQLDDTQLNLIGYGNDTMGNINVTEPRRLTINPYIYLKLNGSTEDSYYELGTTVNITSVNSMLGGSVCINIGTIPGYQNLGCGYENASYMFPTMAMQWKFNDSTIVHNASNNSLFYTTLDKHIEMISGTINVTGLTNGGVYPRDVKIDIGNDGGTDIELPGLLNGTTSYVNTMWDNSSSVLVNYSTAGVNEEYITVSTTSNITYAKINITGQIGRSTFDNITSFQTTYIGGQPLVDLYGVVSNSTWTVMLGRQNPSYLFFYNKNNVYVGNCLLPPPVRVNAQLLATNETTNMNTFIVGNSNGVFSIVNSNCTSLRNITVNTTGFQFGVAVKKNVDINNFWAVGDYSDDNPPVIRKYNLTGYNIQTLTLDSGVCSGIYCGIAMWDDSQFWMADESSKVVRRLDSAGKQVDYFSTAGLNIYLGAIDVINSSTQWNFTLGRMFTQVSSIYKITQQYPQNPSIDMGSDGIIDWNYTGTFSTTAQVNLNVTAINNYIDTECTTGLTCNISLSIGTEGGGSRFNLSTVDLRYTVNPISLNNTATMNWLNSYSGSANNSLNMTYNITASQWGTVTLNGLNIRYRGSATYNVSTNTTSLMMYIVWSNESLALPKSFIEKLYFVPRTNNSKQVEPLGQDSTHPGYNITSYAYHNVGLDFYIKVNETPSCLVQYVSNTSNFASIWILSNSTFSKTLSNCTATFGTNCGSLWFRNNYTNCNATAYNYYAPNHVYETKCSLCQ